MTHDACAGRWTKHYQPSSYQGQNKDCLNIAVILQIQVENNRDSKGRSPLAGAAGCCPGQGVELLKLDNRIESLAALFLQEYLLY